MNKSIKIAILIISTIGLLILPKIAEAIPSDINYRWDDDRSPLTTGTIGDTSEQICQELFAADSTNIFKEVVCSFTRLAALSIANLATEITCSIQQVGNNTNYQGGVTFSGGSGRCTESPENPLGSKTEGSGFYSSELSQSTSELTDSLSPTQSPDPSATYRGFIIARNIMGLMVVVALFVFAFANILYIEVNTYAIKKAIPSIIIAIIGGVLSIYIVFLLSRFVDFTYRLNIFSPYQTYHPMQNIFGGYFSLGATADQLKDGSVRLIFDIGGSLIGTSKISFFAGLLGSVMLVIPALAVFAFEYVLSLRAFAVQVLTIIAPVAFACLVLPQTQIFFRKWWSYMLIAIFFAPLANFVFYVLNLFGPSSTDVTTFMALWFLKTVTLILLVRFPFTVEMDVKKILTAVSKTSFGTALGLNRLATSGVKSPSGEQPIKFANIDKIKNFSKNAPLRTFTPIGKNKTEQINRSQDRQAVAPVGLSYSIEKAVAQASQDNLVRSSDLLIKSSANIASGAFRAVVDQSDLKLWRDTRLIEQLKNHNGQVLDEQGAALRADSARKLMRLSQVVENNKIANPEALKTLAEKGVLDNIPMAIIKKAMDDKVLQKSDLAATFTGNTSKVIQYIENSKQTEQGFLTSAQAKTLMVRDRNDYATGFRDLTKLFANTIRDPSIFPPPPPPVIKNIVSQMKSTDPDIFEKNGMYYLSRLAQIQSGSIKDISSTLTKSGVQNQTAIAIAKNPRIDFADAKKYASREKLDANGLSLLREGFLNRDLSNNLIGSISCLMREQKTLVGKGITQKISESISKNPETKLSDIGINMKKIVQALQKPVTPQDTQKLAQEVDKFYPGAAIKSGLTLNHEDIRETSQKASSILETIETLIKSGINEKVIKENPQKAVGEIEKSVAETIEQVANGQVAKDSEFDTKLSNISKNTTTGQTNVADTISANAR
jgi:hypothetical protein